MSADLQYNVSVVFSSSGRIDGGLQRMQRVQEQGADKYLAKVAGAGQRLSASVGGVFDSAASSFISTAGTVGALAGTAAAAGIGKALHTGIEFADTIERAQLGVATVKTALGDMPFPKALREAVETTEELRKAAARLPGEFKDALEMYSSIVPAGQQLGLDDKMMTKLATRGVAMAAALGINQATFAHELSSALGGRVTSAMPLARKLGLHQSDWKKLKPQERVDYFDKLFTKADPAIEAYSHSWAGLTSATKDNGRNVARAFADPLFGSVKRELERGLDWFGANESSVMTWASTLGHYVSYAFDRGLDKIREWGPAALTFARTVGHGLSSAFNAASPYLARLEKLTLRFMSDPQALDKLAKVAGTLVAARAGVGALGVGSSGLSSLAPLLGSVGGGAASLAAMAPVTAGAAAALGLLAIGTYGATSALTDGSSRYHDAAVKFAASIGVKTTETAASLTRLETSVRPITELFGTVLLAKLDLMATGIQVTIGWYELLGQSLRRFYDWMPDMFKGGVTADEMMTDRREMDYRGFAKALNFDGDGDDYGKAKMKAPVIHQTNYNKVQINVDGTEDPDRVAQTVFEKFDDTIKNPTTSPWDPMADIIRGRDN
ncbi:MAG: hypothetical protein KF795_00610 [Labilithrix sp.]|nr:hypothetical protein [Labilithrix sp.]